MVAVSAKKQENLDHLLEMILLVTEMGEHKANPKRAAAGAVLEAKIDRGRGPVATTSSKMVRSAWATTSSLGRSWAASGRYLTTEDSLSRQRVLPVRSKCSA